MSTILSILRGMTSTFMLASPHPLDIYQGGEDLGICGSPLILIEEESFLDIGTCNDI